MKQIMDEANMVAELMLQPNSLIKGAISSCRPEYENFPDMLEWMLQEVKVKGLRRVLHVMPDALSQTEIFRNNVKRLSGTRLTFDLCTSAKQLSLVAGLVDYCPEVTFILDHCGVPDIKSGEFTQWSNKILELSSRFLLKLDKFLSEFHRLSRKCCLSPII